VALIQVPAENCTQILLADSSALRVGDFVVAVVESNAKGMVMNIKRGNRELYILLK
jgi:hypothetical protein